MTDHQNGQNPSPPKTVPSSTSTPSTYRISGETGNGTSTGFSGQKIHYPNPPDASNPDPATLREQWRYAIRQYSRWYSHAWGTAILAGISFFALGWIIKGSNPLPSLQDPKSSTASSSSPAEDSGEARPWIFKVSLDYLVWYHWFGCSKLMTRSFNLQGEYLLYLSYRIYKISPKLIWKETKIEKGYENMHGSSIVLNIWVDHMNQTVFTLICLFSYNQ